MAIRDFIICFFPADWRMAVVGYDHKKHDGKKKLLPKKIIAPIVTSKDGKVNYIVDLSPLSEEELEALEPYEAFHEVCNFTHLDPYTEKVFKTFQGTIMDALRYISQNFGSEEYE